MRKDCAEKKVNLIGHSTDSAGFSLSASIQLMTPTEATAARGIQYLGLGISDERFVAPYFSAAMVTMTTYEGHHTRDLTFFKDACGHCKSLKRAHVHMSEKWPWCPSLCK